MTMTTAAAATPPTDSYKSNLTSEVGLQLLVEENDNNSNNNNNNNNNNNIIITIDEAIDRLGYGKFQNRILIAVGLCSSSDAMEIMLLSFLSKAVEVEWGLSPKEASSLISIVFVGAFIGTLILGRLGDTMGRKPAFIITASIVAISGISSCLCQNYYQLLVSRFGVGVGIGGITIPFDTFSEFLPTKSRGKLLSLPSYFWTVGTVSVAIIAHYSLGQDPTKWRFLCFYCSIPCIVAVVVGVGVIPESPRWMMLQQQQQQQQQQHQQQQQQQQAVPTSTSNHQQQKRILMTLRNAARMNGEDPYLLFPPETTIVQQQQHQQQNINTNTNANPSSSNRSNNNNNNNNNIAVDSHYSYNNLSNNDDNSHNSGGNYDNYSSTSTSTPKSSNVMKLLSPKWRRIFGLICMMWFGFAIMYYGTALVVTMVFSSSSPSSTTTTTTKTMAVSVDEHQDDNNNNNKNNNSNFHFDYGAIIISTLAEVTGAGCVYMTVDKFGRQNVHSISFGVGGIIIFILCIVASTATTYHQNQKQQRSTLVVLSFLARLFIFVGSSTTWIWTAELLTSDVRTTGHAIANAAGRIGGFLAPYIILVVGASTSSSSSNDSEKDHDDDPSSSSLITIGTVMAIICTMIVFCSRSLPDTHGLPMGSAVHSSGNVDGDNNLYNDILSRRNDDDDYEEEEYFDEGQAEDTEATESTTLRKRSYQHFGMVMEIDEDTTTAAATTTTSPRRIV